MLKLLVNNHPKSKTHRPKVMMVELAVVKAPNSLQVMIIDNGHAYFVNQNKRMSSTYSVNMVYKEVLKNQITYLIYSQFASICSTKNVLFNW